MYDSPAFKTYAGISEVFDEVSNARTSATLSAVDSTDHVYFRPLATSVEPTADNTKLSQTPTVVGGLNCNDGTGASLGAWIVTVAYSGVTASVNCKLNLRVP